MATTEYKTSHIENTSSQMGGPANENDPPVGDDATPESSNDTPGSLGREPVFYIDHEKCLIRGVLWLALMQICMGLRKTCLNLWWRF